MPKQRPSPTGSGPSILTALLTLADFKNRYFVNPPRPLGSPSNCSTKRITVDDDHGGPAIYFNKGDLGVGRKMRCNYNECADETACYVANFFYSTGQSGFDMAHGLAISQDAIIANKPSLGVLLQNTRDTNDYVGLYATMLVILLIGIVVDSLFFGRLEHTIRRRWGLIDSAT